MKNEPFKVLLIEDTDSDAAEIKRVMEMAESSYLETFEVTRKERLATALEYLKSESVDVILLDLGLPDTRGFEGVEAIAKLDPSMPIVVLTRQREETILALEALKKGAQDFFYKGHLGHDEALVRTVAYSIERKRIEKELLAAKEEAQRASRAKSEFLSNMSHDIRTPLNCIVGMTEMLERSKLSEEDANYVQMLNRASDNLLSLVNNILDLSKIESGLFKIGRSEFDLLEVAASVLDVISPRAHSKKIEVVFDVSPDVPRNLVGDAERLKQILTNLLGNAVKFTTTGEVGLEIRLISGGAGTSRIRFIVTDTGSGIPRDKFPLIFEHFTQLSTEVKKVEGSGLGLSICKGLVELMNGTISVESEPGRGSTFTVDVELAAVTGDAANKVVPAANMKGLNAVIVDDNRAHLVGLSRLLGHWGVEVNSCLNADGAIKLWAGLKERRQKIDFWFLDIRMPGIATGGIELARKLLNLGVSAESLIVMLPVIHRHGDIETIKSLGVRRILSKPIRPDELMSVIGGNGPGAAPAAPTVSVPEGTLDFNEGPVNVLVADDSEENLEVIKAYCKNTRISLELAENGEVAVEKFKAGHYDVVLLDLQMPVLGGYGALAEIRKWEAASHAAKTPIVALTAFALNEEAEKCLAAGFDAHVTKPIRKNHLLDVIAKHAVS